MSDAARAGVERPLTRRSVLLGGAAMATITLAPGIQLMAMPERPGVSPAVRWGMLIDTTRCTSDCTACVDACRSENGFDSGIDLRQRPQWIRKVELTDERTGRSASVPVMCQHCSNPPCVDVCPTGASFKRADGLVLVDRHACIGCRYCVMACPYKARSFVHEPVTNQRPDVPRGQGTVEGCTFCVHRLDRGQSPACVEACARDGHGAMLFGNLNDPDSEIARRVREINGGVLRADLAVEPNVRYEGLGL